MSEVVTSTSALSTSRIAVSRADRLCMWSGLGMCVLIGVGFLIGGLVPPPHPSSSAAEVASFYATDSGQRRVGILIMSVGAVLIVTFGIAMASEMRRILGRPSAMPYLQIAGTAFLGTTTAMYLFLALTLTFRVDRSPDLILLLSDMVWIPFIGMWQPGLLQALAVAGTVFSDPHHDQPGHWPRWAGWLALWYAFTSLIGLFVPFFHGGPLSWVGVFPFYLGATALIGWWMVMAVLMLRTTRGAKLEELR